jgi:hypothetical protein
MSKESVVIKRYYPLLDRVIHRIINAEIPDDAMDAEAAVMLTSQVNLAFGRLDKKAAETHVMLYLMTEQDIASGMVWETHHVN